MEKILLPVDGSTSCNKAVKKVSEIASWTEVEVSLINIIEENPSLSEVASKDRIKDSFNKQEELENQAKEVVNSCGKSLEGKVQKLNKIIKTGNPATKICSEANEGDYDMVVISDMGKSAVKKFFLGSTTEKVVRYCNKTVVVVK